MTLTVVKAEPSGESPAKGASQPPGDGSAGSTSDPPAAPPVDSKAPETSRPIPTPARAPAVPGPVKIESKLKLSKEQTRQDQ